MSHDVEDHQDVHCAVVHNADLQAGFGATPLSNRSRNYLSVLGR